MRYALLALAVLAVACLFAGCTDDTPSEMKAWGATAQLDLPINVTRAISPGVTTFTFLARGDETYVTITTASYAPRGYFPHTTTYQAPLSEITIAQESSIIDHGVFGKSLWARDPEVKIIRTNGAVETYFLPCRGDRLQSWLER